MFLSNGSHMDWCAELPSPSSFRQEKKYLRDAGHIYGIFTVVSGFPGCLGTSEMDSTAIFTSTEHPNLQAHGRSHDAVDLGYAPLAGSTWVPLPDISLPEIGAPGLYETLKNLQKMFWGALST